MVTSEARKAYLKEYCATNKEKIAAYNKEYRATNKEKIAERYQANKENNREKTRAYYHANKEKKTAYYQTNKERREEYLRANKENTRAYYQAYQQANPGKMSAKTAKRRAAKIQRTPNWLTPDDYHAIRTLYETAAALTESTGINHQVDHIIPLQGKIVSGFHCPTNLQILTATENHNKYNKFTGEH